MALQEQLNQLKEQFTQLLLKLGIVKDSAPKEQSNQQSSSPSKSGSTSSSSGITFSKAMQNFQKDLPHWGEHLAHIGSYPQDKQIAFALMCCGLILIIVGLVVQFVF